MSRFGSGDAPPGCSPATPCTPRWSSARSSRSSTGPLGVLTVIRGHSFAGGALGDIGRTGGSAAFLVGVGTRWGFVVVNLAAAVMMELAGIGRRRGRDVAVGVVLAAIVLTLLVVVSRPPLLSSVSPDLAAARGVPVSLVGWLISPPRSSPVSRSRPRPRPRA